jgi:Flp pilus assembly protein CpaB
LAFENKKQILIIGGAVVAGVAAVILTSNYVKGSIEGQTASLAEQYDVKQKEMVSEIQQRSDQQMAALAQELEHVKSEQAAAMQKQIASMQQAQQQEALMQEKTVQVQKVRKSSLALKTPVGKRAVTVMIDSLAAVGGLINAGDFVDVIAELNVPSQDPDKKTVTAMIFQGLQVLAVNTNLDDPGAYDDQQAATSLKITFAVDPQEAGLLAFANKNGSLELALRSPNESRGQTVKADTWKTLADYVLKNQGLDIQNPDGESTNNKTIENKPSIQIFRGGKEL